MRLTINALLITAIIFLGSVGMVYSYIVEAKQNSKITAKFKKTDLPKIIKITPNNLNSASLYQTFDIEFDRQVATDSIKLSSNPDARLAISQTKSDVGPMHLIIAPLSKLKPNTKYQIKISKGTNANAEFTIAKEEYINFTTGTRED